MANLLIIGGSDAGISAALRAREVDPSGKVTVVVADQYPNYSICGPPFWLGAQIVGHRTAEVSKRVDVFAAALFNEMTVDALNDVDLSYTPPLSTPWDAVQVAAQAWIKDDAGNVSLVDRESRKS